MCANYQLAAREHAAIAGFWNEWHGESIAERTFEGQDRGNFVGYAGFLCDRRPSGKTRFPIHFAPVLALKSPLGDAACRVAGRKVKILDRQQFT